ncbi:MAG: RNA methyltransferase substrate-binding domain-containing protein [Verrucomicrobiota bacterium]
MSTPIPANQTPAEDWIICGRAAIESTYENRPKALRKLWLTEENQGSMGQICHYLADQKRSYSQQTHDRLTRVVKHPNHDGLIAFIDPPLQPKFQISHLADWQKSGEPLLIIDRILDPIELGRMLRVAVSFGLRRALLADNDEQAKLDGAVYSGSHGALEHIRCYRIGKLLPLMKPLESHFLAIGIGGPGASRPKWDKPPRAPGRPSAIILSDRPEGLDKKLVPLCESRIYLPNKGPLPLLPGDNLSAILAWLTTDKKEHANTGFRARQAAKKG